jgi:AcrR family transcriptional regulator
LTSRQLANARTREAIAHAARALFVARGYGDTSVRDIAADAGVDPALVIRHFGSKEKLFLETVEFTDFFAQVMAGPLDGMGPRLVGLLLADQHDPTFSAYRAMMRATDSEVVRSRLTVAIQQMLVEPLTPRLRGQHRALRARLIAAQLAGLLDALTILGDEVVAKASRSTLRKLYGAALQALIDPV